MRNSAGYARARNIPFEGFCWYPFIDSTDWCSLVTQANCNIDPQGIFWLDAESKKRNASVLSKIFAALARGAITSEDIPAYRFQGPLDHSLRNFLAQMEHWDWQEPFMPNKKYQTAFHSISGAGISKPYFAEDLAVVPG